MQQINLVFHQVFTRQFLLKYLIYLQKTVYLFLPNKFWHILWLG